MCIKRKVEPTTESDEFSHLTWQELRDKLEEIDLQLYPSERGMITETLKRIMDRIVQEEKL